MAPRFFKCCFHTSFGTNLEKKLYIVVFLFWFDLCSHELFTNKLTSSKYEVIWTDTLLIDWTVLVDCHLASSAPVRVNQISSLNSPTG